MVFTTDDIAALLADAHLSGWRDGHMLCPQPDTDSLFIGYSQDIEKLCADHVEH